ncbi:hypothetical protein VDGE_06940 [Verticillium dahliae]|uniref:DUF7514 domain-containing protein n=1 Tax=Verticillium dahliae TaxID=27337 RepID=A0A444SB12_VERDA|nr:hypothetical protein VDGE_06940 [Verticillium dahliae]
MGRQPPPPQVEDVAEDGDDMRVPDLELSPAPSEASFESDAHDKLGSEMPKTPQTPASPAMSHSSVSLITPSAQPRHDMTGITPRFMDELRTMIKQEIAGHLKSMDPAPSPGITPSALMNSMFGTAYPSPPPSVVSTFQIPSPQSTSPRFTTAEVLPKRPTVRFRSRVPPIIHAQPRVCGTGETRATSAIQTAGVVSEGKTWEVLFDAEGYSTQRLGQALHSLACRVIDAFGIPGTDLITPDKMQNFYAKYRIENEEFPLQDAFKPCKNTTFERTQYLYQDLDCPYSLSQAVPQAHPTIPGLTRMGFVKWMTINILAYPDQESRRFGLLLPDLAPLKIIGPDGAQECLPYTLPRNLLPATHDKKVQDRGDFGGEQTPMHQASARRSQVSSHCHHRQ